MKKNIQNLIKIIAFLLIIIFILIVFTYMLKRDIIDLDIITGFYAEKKETLDTVYIGGSATFVYWQPLEAYKNYGIASYNFASSTIQLELYKYMIKEILKAKSQNY